MFRDRVQNMSITYHFAHPALLLWMAPARFAGSLTVTYLSNGYLECAAIDGINTLEHSYTGPAAARDGWKVLHQTDAAERANFHGVCKGVSRSAASLMRASDQTVLCNLIWGSSGGRFYAADVKSIQSSDEAIGDESALKWKVELWKRPNGERVASVMTLPKFSFVGGPTVPGRRMQKGERSLVSSGRHDVASENLPWPLGSGRRALALLHYSGAFGGSLDACRSCP